MTPPEYPSKRLNALRLNIRVLGSYSELMLALAKPFYVSGDHVAGRFFLQRAKAAQESRAAFVAIVSQISGAK